VPFEPIALGIGTLAIFALAALVAGVVSLTRRGDVIARRLAALPVGPEPTVESLLQARRPGASVVGRILAPIGRLARPARREELERLQKRLLQGGIRGEHALPVYLATKVVLAVGFVAAFLWVNARRTEPLEPAFAIAVVTFAAGFYLPEGWLSSRIRARQTAIERGLPDALDLLVTCVEAGLGLDASLQRVADEVRLAWRMLADELQTTFLETKAGIPRIEAFRRLAARTGVRDLKSLAATLTQTEIFGTSVATALRIQAEGIRVRRMQRAEEKAAYVSVKMTLPLVLCILPSLLAIVIGPAIVGIATNLLPMLGRGP
jgi:tight adherence protein C